MKSAALDWDGIGDELAAIGCAPSGRLLQDGECARLIDL